MVISNSEKQRRFRKREALRRDLSFAVLGICRIYSLCPQMRNYDVSLINSMNVILSVFDKYESELKEIDL